MFFVYLLDQLFRGFIFNEINLTDTPLLPIVALYFMVVVLWVIGNSMVSSINDGEGSIKNVYVMTAYSLAPYLLIIPPTVLLSYILTFNEAFIIQFLWIQQSLGQVSIYFVVSLKHMAILSETLPKTLF